MKLRRIRVIACVLLAAVMCALAAVSASAGALDETENVDASVLPAGQTDAQQVDIRAASAILVEVSTGQVLYEYNPDEVRAPASITKVMTALLVMEAIERGSVTLDQMVTVSPNAMAMGGTTIFLETGEVMSVNDLLKGMMVNSANDAAVALAECVSGTEEAFVSLMNERAAQLGMTSTHFKNSHGLDEDGHQTTARDIAIMSAELLRHERILEYTKIWTDTLRNGATELANTNKLIRFYDCATGLKTGTTNNAGRCVSASARKDGMHLVAVVLGGLAKNDQFNTARSLLEWGFANYCMASPPVDLSSVTPIPVRGGTLDEVLPQMGEIPKILCQKGGADELQGSVELLPELEAPVTAGQQVGKVRLTRNGTVVAEIPITAAAGAERMTFFRALGRLLKALFCEI